MRPLRQRAPLSTRRCSRRLGLGTQLLGAFLGLAGQGCSVLVERELASLSDKNELELTDAASEAEGSSVEAGSERADAAPDGAGEDAALGARDAGASFSDADKLRLCVGMDHACGLTEQGKLVCWGDDAQGQRDLPEDRTYREIACGDFHTCALDAQGDLVCAGRNADGQRANAEGPFTQVTAGDSHTCVLDGSGRARCFGRDVNGQASPPDDLFSRVSAGTSLTCGIRERDASLLCWGAAASTYTRAAEGKRLVSLDVGASTVCGVSDAQEAQCWGDLAYRPPTLGRVAQLAVGAYSGCALLEDLSAHCWYGGTHERVGAEDAKFVRIGVGGAGRCFVPLHGPVQCEAADASLIAPGSSIFP